MITLKIVSYGKFDGKTSRKMLWMSVNDGNQGFLELVESDINPS